MQPEDGGAATAGAGGRVVAEMVKHGADLVIVAGEEPPAMSVAFADPEGQFSGFSVIYSELDPDDDDTASSVVCLHCLLEDGDEQLARGLDLARVHGQVDFDPDAGESFVPADKFV